jgi:hypothetical protein
VSSGASWSAHYELLFGDSLLQLLCVLSLGSFERQKLCTPLPPLPGAGIDVNVKFHNAHAFEPTPEVAVFDLLGIPLVHGWLVDPLDGQAAAVFGTR